MKKFVRDSQKGQVLIIVAIALTALLAFVALAIDIGNMYQVRRQMQNAADAGALAGARELCEGKDEVAAKFAAEEYAITYNDAETADVKIDKGRVTVVAEKRVDMYVAPIIGISETNVTARAVAACSGADSACGLWPMAFPLTLWEDIPCGKNLFVWAGDQDNPNPRKEDQLSCDCWECDLDKGVVVTGDGRAWLDFYGVAWDAPDLFPDGTSCAKQGCGFTELRCWMLEDTSARLRLPACVPGNSGVRAAAKDAVEARVNDIVRVPLFVEDLPDPPPCPSENNCAGQYVITTIGCVRVVRWIKNSSQELPELKLKDPLPSECGNITGPKQFKLIEVTKYCDSDCSTSCGTSGGEISDPGILRAVSLIE